MQSSDSRTQPPEQKRPYPPIGPARTKDYARDAGLEITGLSSNESASQWLPGNAQSGYQGRKTKTSDSTTRQQFAFPAPPNQPYRAGSVVQPLPGEPDDESTPPQSAAPSRIASSRASTVSSIGTIPDFPLPQLPLPAVATQRKGQPLGPPPSARRPGPTYFTRDSFVTPIAEESPEGSPRSFAFAENAASNHGSRGGGETRSRSPFVVERGESDVQHISTRRDATRLIQQASRDHKVKPELVITSSPSGPNVQQASSFRFPFASPTRSRASSEDELELERPPLARFGSRSRSPLLSPDGETPSPLSEMHFHTPPSMSDKIPSSQRPPRLDLNTVRESETRGSLTSLPDLIRRATRLAANLDRGKTASRLGMLDMFSNSEKLNRDKTDAQSTMGSMSDMLSAFPIPGTAPTLNHLASDYGTARKRSNAEQKKRGRRCCGMSLWVFILICLALVVLIAAAVLVPVFLIVLPQQHQAQRNAASQATLSDCPASFPCSNGGVSVINNNVCSCICANGFTGSQCTTAEDPGCITTDVAIGSQRISNATLGASIPRLLTESLSNFSIPLNSTSLLSLFSANNLSCTSEDALVTFNSQSAKSKRFYIVPEEEVMPQKASNDVTAPTARATLATLMNGRRDSQAVATSAGIVFQQSSTTTSAVSRTAAATASPIPSATANGPSLPQSEDTLDFARVAVLYVLEQTSNLHAAIKAQQSMQDLFLQSHTSGRLALNLGSLSVTADFDSFVLDFGNGTVVGGNGNGKGGLKGTGQRVRRRGYSRGLP